MKIVKQAVGYWCEDIVRRRYLGRGVCAAVLDTGIAFEHPDFGNRIIDFQDCVNHKRRIYDDSGHGTHVAGILAGNGRASGGVYAGIAPEAKLVIGKVLDREGNGSVEDVLDGIEWILSRRRRHGIRIVNISVGSKPDLEAEQKAQLLRGVERLWDEGLVVIVSAGNYGPGRGSVAIPGASRKVITVGVYECSKESGKPGGRWKYSGQGPAAGCVVKPDLVAPGVKVLSCSSGYAASGYKSLPYTAKSGTSMAAPVISGAVACLLSKYPDMTNVDVKLKLRESCRYLGEEGTGWGLIDIRKLMS